MKRLAWMGCLLIAGCQGDPPPVVDASQVIVSRPVEGRITVEGAPGAVAIPGASTVTLVVLQETESPRQVLHLGGVEVPIATVTAPVTADGGFAPVVLGEAGKPILPDDELTLTPYQGMTQVGYTIRMFVPFRSPRQAAR